MPALVVSSHEEINTVLARILEVVTAIDTQAYAGPEIADGIDRGLQDNASQT